MRSRVKQFSSGMHRASGRVLPPRHQHPSTHYPGYLTHSHHPSYRPSYRSPCHSAPPGCRPTHYPPSCPSTPLSMYPSRPACYSHRPPPPAPSDTSHNFTFSQRRRFHQRFWPNGVLPSDVFSPPPPSSVGKSLLTLMFS